MTKTAVNLFSVIGGEILLRAANFAAVVVIARLYGAAVLGVYATVLAFITVAVMVADNGLQVSSITEIARKPEVLGFTLGQLYCAKTFLFLLMMLILAGFGGAIQASGEIWLMAGFLTVRTMLYSYCQLHAGALKALNRMPMIGMVQSIHCCLLLCGVGLAYYHSWNIYLLLAWLLLCQAFELAASGILLIHVGTRPRWSSFAECWRTLHRSTPIGVTYSAAALILRADVIVLSWIVSAREVGYFAAADVPLVMVYVVSWLLGGIILPQMVALCGDPARLQAYSKRWIRFLLITTVPVCVVQLGVTPRALSFLYGHDFSATGRIAAIMGLAVPFVLCNSVLLSRAIATGAHSIYLGTYLSTGALAIVLDYSLGRSYGAPGIAVAVVVREAAMFAAFMVLGVRRSPQHSSDARVNGAFARVTDSTTSGSLS